MLRPAGKFSQPIGNVPSGTPSIRSEVRVVSQGMALARSAPELLEDYVRTGSQAPFEEVVRRYAGMVFNVCYQILKDSHDAEDATQAVFLALAVQAKTANGVKYLAPWLQKVAQRLSLDVRRSKTRRKAREERHSQMRLQMGIENDPTRQPGMDELKIILRDELDKLPSKYRLPLVLHYFGGLKPEEISKELGCKPSTLGVRLHRGRKMLADLLSERGIVVNGSMLSIALAACVQCRISETLVHTTAHAAGAYAMQGSFGAAITPQVIGFKHIASQGIFLAKVKAAVAAGVLAAAAAAGAAELVNRVIPQSWRFDIRTELKEWLKPSFSMPAPDLRVDARDVVEHTPVLGSTPGIYELSSAVLVSTISERSAVPSNLNAPTGVAVGLTIASLPVSDTPYGEPASVSQGGGSPLPSPVVRSAVKNTDLSIVSSGGENAVAASSAGGSGGGGGSGDVKISRASLAPPPPAIVVHNPNGTNKAPAQPFMPRASNHLTVAAAQGEIRSLVFDKSTKVSTDTFSIGGQGSSSLTAQSGTFSVASRLTVGDAFGGTGEAIFAKTSAVYAPTVSIGEDGKGTMSVLGHASVVANSISAGQNSPGTINLSGNGSIESKSLAVGLWNNGVMNQDGGVARMSNFLGNVGLAQLGVGAGSEGTYYLQNGTLDAGKQIVGVRGNGHLYQTGGVNSVQTLEMGSERGSSGSLQLPGGTLQFTRSQADSPVGNDWIVGREGRGTVVLSSAASEGMVSETGTGRGTNFIIRASETGEGTLLGWGRVMLTGTLDQSGQVIADGFGHDRTLDLSTFDAVVNSFDNPPDCENGWYARNGGKLRLPINRDSSPGAFLVDSYTFGEAKDDASLDLVNAVRVAFNPRLDESSPVMISLVSSDGAGVPAGAKDLSFVSMYETNFGSLPVESVELSIRYDAIAIGNNTPRLLAWQSGGWRNLADSEFHIDSTSRLIVASTSPANFYAVAVPEPVGAALLLMGGALLARRRRI